MAQSGGGVSQVGALRLSWGRFVASPALGPLLPSCSSSSSGARPGLPRCPVYLELAYLPGSASAQKVDEDFFRCVRSQCYVISGEDHLKESVLRGILDALLSGKQHWSHDTQVGPGGSFSAACTGPRLARLPPGDCEGRRLRKTL